MHTPTQEIHLSEHDPVNSELFERTPADPVDEEAEAAAAEAGEIGGHTPTEGLPEAERPLAEGGEGEAEGFELAEQQLIESASHGDASGHPLGRWLPRRRRLVGEPRKLR